MNEDRILLASPHMSAEGYEEKFVKEAFATNWIAPLGANVNGFEKELASYVQLDMLQRYLQELRQFTWL